MNLPSKLFFFILLVATGVAAALSYYRYIILHEYRVEGEPTIEEEVGVQSVDVAPPSTNN